MSVLSKSAVPVVDVNTYTRGILGPSNEMLGPVKNGGVIKAGTPPGCWGPMITLSFKVVMKYRNLSPLRVQRLEMR